MNPNDKEDSWLYYLGRAVFFIAMILMISVTSSEAAEVEILSGEVNIPVDLVKPFTGQIKGISVDLKSKTITAKGSLGAIRYNPVRKKAYVRMKTFTLVPLGGRMVLIDDVGTPSFLKKVR